MPVNVCMFWQNWLDNAQCSMKLLGFRICYVNHAMSPSSSEKIKTKIKFIVFYILVHKLNLNVLILWSENLSPRIFNICRICTLSFSYTFHTDCSVHPSAIVQHPSLEFGYSVHKKFPTYESDLEQRHGLKCIGQWIRTYIYS